jgi:PAS domain S-box-containing protein
MTAFSALILLLTGASWFAGLTHFVIGVRQISSPTHLIFAVLALLAGLHALMFVPLHHAPDVEHYVLAMRWALIFGSLTLGMLPWFAYFYAGATRLWPPVLLSALYLGLAITNLLLPYALFFDAPPRLVHFETPWGESMTNHAGIKSTFGVLVHWSVHLCLFAYVYRACIAQYRRGQRQHAVALAVSTTIIGIAMAANLVIGVAAPRTPFVAEFGFLALVLLMMFWVSSDERFRTLFAQATDGIFLADSNGRYIDVNDAGLALLGYSRNELRRMHVLDVVVPGHAAGVEIERTSLLDGRTIRSEWEFRRKDGSTFPGELSGRMLADGRLLGLVRDISEHKEIMRSLEERVAARTAEYAELNRQLESFSYSVSHDLRAPIRAISGFSAMLSQSHAHTLDEEGRRQLSRIEAAAGHMNELIEGLLQLARVSHQPLRNESVDLCALAQEIIHKLHEQEPTRRVDFQCSGTLHARGDSRLLRIVVHNLVENAWKYTSNTENARIEFGCDTSRGEAAYYLRDNGAGFDMKYAERLFEPFQRLHSATEFTGTGIGLATVARVVQRHGGKIWAEAALGQGATFFFTLGPARPRAIRTA